MFNTNKDVTKVAGHVNPTQQLIHTQNMCWTGKGQTTRITCIWFTQITSDYHEHHWHSKYSHEHSSVQFSTGFCIILFAPCFWECAGLYLWLRISDTVWSRCEQSNLASTNNLDCGETLGNGKTKNINKHTRTKKRVRNSNESDSATFDHQLWHQEEIKLLRNIYKFSKVGKQFYFPPYIENKCSLSKTLIGKHAKLSNHMNGSKFQRKE